VIKVQKNINFTYIFRKLINSAPLVHENSHVFGAGTNYIHGQRSQKITSPGDIIGSLVWASICYDVCPTAKLLNYTFLKIYSQHGAAGMVQMLEHL
jgi:hypothetical protein